MTSRKLLNSIATYVQLRDKLNDLSILYVGEVDESTIELLRSLTDAVERRALDMLAKPSRGGADRNDA